MYKLKEIKFEVTDRCPLNCIHCSTDAGISNSIQVPWEDAQRIILAASVIGVENISFSGGEPLLWPELEKAVLFASELGVQTTLYTTGAYVNREKILPALYASGLGNAIFSLYSANAKVHDLITKSIGSFDRSISAIKLAIKIGLDVGIHFVPMKINYKDLAAVADLCSFLSVPQISVLRLVPQGRGAGNKDLILNKEETLELKSTIQILKKSGKNIRIGSPYNILAINGNPTCSAGVDRLTIAPDLTIYPCDAFKQASPESVLNASDDLSNLKKNSLRDCWENSVYLKFVRESLKQAACDACQTCRLYPKCLSGCAAQKLYAYGTIQQMKDPLCLVEK